MELSATDTSAWFARLGVSEFMRIGGTHGDVFSGAAVHAEPKSDELFELRDRDAGALLQALADVVLPAGGWPLYGASKFVQDLYDDATTHPAYHAIMRAAIQFMVDADVPVGLLTEREWDYYDRHVRSG